MKLTETTWQSSYELQSFLKHVGCEITNQVKPDYVDVYYPKSQKVITMKASGKLPPEAVMMIIRNLGIPTA